MKISSGSNPPNEINVYIEIPQGSLIKYELDKEQEAIFVDRFAFTTMGYPANYGFVPNTRSLDGDPVDVLVLSSYAVHPATVIPAVPIALLEMEDEAGVDAKIIAVPKEKVDPFFGIWKKLADIPESYKNRIKHFFEHYKELEKGKWVKIKEWKDKEVALEEIKSSLKK
ncbi:inorganic diphosphatase [Candidatus Gottesmanbacteria bacterium]|nr:inorganic diphosphatase [Candidatus Gottesmanbacteria bacterium]